MDHMAIFFFGFLSNVILQLLDPVFTFLPTRKKKKRLAEVPRKSGMEKEVDVLRYLKHVVEYNAAAGHVYINRERLGFGLRLKNLSLITASTGGFIGPSKFPHQCISAVVVEVHAGDISII